MFIIIECKKFTFYGRRLENSKNRTQKYLKKRLFRIVNSSLRQNPPTLFIIFIIIFNITKLYFSE